MAHHIVITRLRYEAASREEVLQIVRESIEIFLRQPGLLSARWYLLEAEREVVTTLEWESEAAHLACMESEDFEVVGARWGALLEDDRMTWDMATAEVLHGYEA